MSDGSDGRARLIPLPFGPASSSGSSCSPVASMGRSDRPAGCTPAALRTRGLPSLSSRRRRDCFGGAGTSDARRVSTAGSGSTGSGTTGSTATAISSVTGSGSGCGATGAGCSATGAGATSTGTIGAAGCSAVATDTGAAGCSFGLRAGRRTLGMLNLRSRRRSDGFASGAVGASVAGASGGSATGTGSATSASAAPAGGGSTGAGVA